MTAPAFIAHRNVSNMSQARVWAHLGRVEPLEGGRVDILRVRAPEAGEALGIHALLKPRELLIDHLRCRFTSITYRVLKNVFEKRSERGVARDCSACTLGGSKIMLWRAAQFSSEPKDVDATPILIDESKPEDGIDEERVGCYRGRHPIHVVEERGNSVLGLLVSLQAIDKGALKESELALVKRLAEGVEVLLLD